MGQNEPSETPAQPGVLPEYIRQNLRKYHQHAERITCLECGYVGPMGIKRRVKPWYASWWAGILPAVLAVTALSILLDGLGLMAALISGGLVSATTFLAGSVIYECPNCNAELSKS